MIHNKIYKALDLEFIYLFYSNRWCEYMEEKNHRKHQREERWLHILPLYFHRQEERKMFKKRIYYTYGIHIR